jgi:maltose-binding protein MalE
MQIRFWTPVFLLIGLAACGRVDRSRSVSVWEQMDPQEQILFDRQLEEFRAEHPEFAGFDIHRIHFRIEDLRTQYQTAALAYGGPNLVFGPADQIGPFSIMGLIQPIEEFLGPDELVRFDPAALPVLDGHVYGLPDQVGNHLTLVANLAHVDRVAGDTDSWLAQLQRVTRDDDDDGRPEVFGLVYNMLEQFWLVPWLGGFGGWVMDEQLAPTLDSEAMASALAFLKRLKDLGVTPRECDYPLADTLFREGRAAYIINGPWSWENYTDEGITIELAPIPKVSETGLWPSPATATKCYSVNAYIDPATVDCTAALLRFLTSEKVQTEKALAMGVLPADLGARENPEVVADPIQAASADQIAKGRLMPIVPQMRAIWDAMRPYFQSVLNDEMSPGEAAQAMQDRAVRMIQEMTE